jgi:predicted metalloprotease
MRFPRSWVALLASCALLSGCGGIVGGNAVSPIYDPDTAGGLALTTGPSGLRPDAPAATMTVHGGDGGEIDKLAAPAVEDIEQYWATNYPRTLSGTNRPVTDLYSFDSRRRTGDTVCGSDTYDEVNAFFCQSGWLIAWDRGKFFPTGRKFFGDMVIPGVLSHEYGHAIQYMADLVGSARTALAGEQRADCFGADYMRWVAAGHSPRFTLDTSDGLNKLLAGVITSRDPEGTHPHDRRAHGTALDRIAAIQLGFTSGATACAAITDESIAARRSQLPESLRPDSERPRNRPITQDSVAQAADELVSFYALQDRPTLSFSAIDCAAGPSTTPVSYCPGSNTVAVDLGGLQKLGEPGTEYDDFVLLQGTHTAMSALASRYALAAQRAKGLPMNSTTTALRTACLTGAFDRHLGETENPAHAVTSADIDQAVAGLLGNGLAASDANGMTVPAGFNRIAAYRDGLTNSADRCYADFHA